MELWKLLDIRPGLTAVIGSGGKTSLLRVLAQELSRRGSVLLATTTHILRPDWCPFADVLPCPVVYGSLARGAWRSL